MPYLIAVAFRDGVVSTASFAPDSVRDPGLRPIMQKIRINENQEFTRQYPEAQLAELEVVSRSGERATERLSHPKGHRKNPLSDGEVEEKFYNLAQPVLTLQECQKALEALWGLEEIEDAGDVIALFVV